MCDESPMKTYRLLLMLYFSFLGASIPTVSLARPVYLAYATNISSLDPILQDDLTASSIIVQIYEGLFGYGKSGNVEPKLVSDWKISSDQKVYTFTLKEGVRFSDGKILDAYAVKDSFERLGSKQSLNSWALEMINGYSDFRSGRSNHILGIRVVGNHQVQIKLNRPFQPFLSLLASTYFRIAAPTETLATFGCPPLVGTGPYSCDTLEPNSKAILTRNPSYHGGNNNIEKIVYKKMTHKMSVQAFNDGEIDLLRNYDDSVEVTRMDAKEMKGYQFSTWYFAINVEKAPGSSKSFRRYLASSISKKQIATVAGPEVGVATGLLPNGFLVKSNLDDDKRANGVKPLPNVYNNTIDILFCKSTPNVDRIINIIEAKFQKAGIRYRILLEPFDEYYRRRRNGGFTMILANVIPDYGDPDAIIYPYFYSKSPASITQHHDRNLDRMIVASRSEEDRMKRAKIIESIDRYLVRQNYIIPLYHDDLKIFIDQRLNVPLISGLGPWFLEYNNVYWN